MNIETRMSGSMHSFVKMRQDAIAGALPVAWRLGLADGTRDLMRRERLLDCSLMPWNP